MTRKEFIFEDEIKLATLGGVREHTEGAPVELWINTDGRVVVRAYNECGNNLTDVDLFDLLDWSRSGDGKCISTGSRDIIDRYITENVDPTVEALVRRALQVGYEIGAKRD